jgi:uncharacterized cupredoxin-like copper-binding protein
MRWFVSAVALSVLALAIPIAVLSMKRAPDAGGGPVAAAFVIDDARFNPNRFDVRVGQELTLTITNAGTHRHDVLFASAHMPALAGAEAIIDPGQSQTLILVFDTPGVHTFYCSEPGHAGSSLTGAVWVTN